MPRLLFMPRKEPVPTVQEAGWAPGPVWTGAENLALTGIRSPNQPACSQSLYRLCYLAHVPANSWQEILQNILCRRLHACARARARTHTRARAHTHTHRVWSFKILSYLQIHKMCISFLSTTSGWSSYFSGIYSVRYMLEICREIIICLQVTCYFCQISTITGSAQQSLIKISHINWKITPTPLVLILLHINRADITPTQHII
jgi:hypothetical protein